MAEDARDIDLMEDAADLAGPEQIFRERFSPGADYNGQCSVGCWQTSTAITCRGK